MDMEEIPQDAWAVRIEQYSSEVGETLFGAWHRTAQWVRRNGNYSGLVTVCQRVYNSGVWLRMSDPDQSKHPQGALCPECFGIDDSSQI